MESIVELFDKIVAYAVPFVILLGLLIFVHELGHFLVAKYFKVRVEVFSLGFGKKLFKFRRGDTDYCLSLIPFGGYVKMFGDDPAAVVSSEERQFSFNHKPVSQRIAVVLAGPLMNLIFAFFLFGVIAMLGERVLSPRVGDLSKQKSAYKTGLRSGDLIKTVDGQSIATWTELTEIIEESAGQTLRLEVQSYGQQDLRTVQVEPLLTKNKNILSTKDKVGMVDGLNYQTKASSVGIGDPTSIAGVVGFKTKDLITSVNAQKVSTWIELIDLVGKLKDESTLIFEVERGPFDHPDKKILKIENVPNFEDGLARLRWAGLESAGLFISKIMEDSVAGESGLLKGDRMISINDHELQEWEDVKSHVNQYKTGNPGLKVVIGRDGLERNFDLIPRKMKQVNIAGKEIEVFVLGVTTSLTLARPETFISRTLNPILALVRGVEQTWFWTKITCISFLRLIQREVSAKSIGGPIMIGQLAGDTFKIGLSPFLRIMSIISINLFILNLLPIPVLDGGHLLFYLIEAIKGSPLSLRKMEIAQQVGLLLLMALMVLAIFNDVTRLFD